MVEELQSGEIPIESPARTETETSGELISVSARTESTPSIESGERVEGAVEQNVASKLTSLQAAAKRLSAPPLAADDTTDDARSLSLVADIESQVTRLIDLALQKGIPHAVDVAQKMKNYYLLDQMHDRLVDGFYQGLVEKGLLEKD